MSNSTSSRKWILLGLGGIGLVFLLTWGIARLIAGLFPDDPPKKIVKVVPGARRGNIKLPNQYKYIKIPTPAKTTKAKKAPKRREWVGRKPNLPSHEELMRRARLKYTKRRGIPQMPKPGSDHYRIKRSTFKDWVNKPLSESGATWRPFQRRRMPVGMRVVDLEPGSFLARLGLRKNDVLVSVNGRQVIAPSHARKYYKQIASGSRNLTLTIIRGGNTIRADFSLIK